MRTARVVGQVVSSAKLDSIAGRSLLLLQDLDPALPDQESAGAYAAIDLIGAGRGEVVLVVTGSAARVGLDDRDTPVDAAVVGIVDSLIVDGSVTYEK
ncbi:EutN/CcmL family microcompartment protein [Gordonia hydrophobica]|uniref:EutN/CcmL family microcompartment protein n=1 Tax=Gordonia hydrophobica TaxID=40516 RepID=A0ABZ2U6J0_9ACTN|nr:EutN/CcmL family microcompartment protein [Gordonia hydrophobica]MBM7365390.1 ethanolamine utilization protein EutN [Gordonia hydrophobica]